MLYRLLIAIFALTVVTACGSSSSSDDAPPPPPPANGDTNGDDDDDDDDDDDNGNGLPVEGDISFRFSGGIDGWYINGTGDTTTVETDFFRIAHDADLVLKSC